MAGHGIALASLTLVAGDLAAGRLVQPFGPEIDGHAYHLVQAADRAPRPPVQAVMAWLREEAGASA